MNWTLVATLVQLVASLVMLAICIAACIEARRIRDRARRELAVEQINAALLKADKVVNYWRCHCGASSGPIGSVLTCVMCATDIGPVK